jgi:hypothetical protein
VRGLVSDAGSFLMSLKGLVLCRLIGVVPMVAIPWSEPRSNKKLKYARLWSTCRKSFSHRGDGSVTSLTVSFDYMVQTTLPHGLVLSVDDFFRSRTSPHFEVPRGRSRGREPALRGPQGLELVETVEPATD